jgi:hypothetical protein
MALEYMPAHADIWNRVRGVKLGTLSLDADGVVVPDNDYARGMTKDLYVQRVTDGKVQLGNLVSYADGKAYLHPLPFAIHGTYVSATFTAE